MHRYHTAEEVLQGPEPRPKVQEQELRNMYTRRKNDQAEARDKDVGDAVLIKRMDSLHKMKSLMLQRHNGILEVVEALQFLKPKLLV